MATTTQQPDTKAYSSPPVPNPSAVPQDLETPHFDLTTPLYDQEARQADKARREAAVTAFRNEKAHEPPPRHQA